MWLTAVLSGVFGLLGVVVGATVTAISDHRLARRPEEARLRAAARLVARELGDNRARLDVMRSSPFMVGSWLPLERSLWSESEKSFARELSPARWRVLDTAWERTTAYGLLLESGSSPSEPERLRMARETLEALSDAWYPLRELAEDEPSL